MEEITFTPISVSNKKRDKTIIECEYSKLEDNFLDFKMPNYYRVLAHHNDDKNWEFLSYHNITTLTKWGDIPKLYNTLNFISLHNSVGRVAVL